MSGISRSLTIKLDMVTKSRCMKSKDWVCSDHTCYTHAQNQVILNLKVCYDCVIHVRYYWILSEYTISKNMECLDHKCKHNNQYLLNLSL
jgi:hypothetical protein